MSNPCPFVFKRKADRETKDGSEATVKKVKKNKVKKENKDKKRKAKVFDAEDSDNTVVLQEGGGTIINYSKGSSSKDEGSDMVAYKGGRSTTAGREVTDITAYDPMKGRKTAGEEKREEEGGERATEWILGLPELTAKESTESVPEGVREFGRRTSYVECRVALDMVRLGRGGEGETEEGGW